MLEEDACGPAVAQHAEFRAVGVHVEIALIPRVGLDPHLPTGRRDGQRRRCVPCQLADDDERADEASGDEPAAAVLFLRGMTNGRQNGPRRTHDPILNLLADSDRPHDDAARRFHRLYRPGARTLPLLTAIPAGASPG